MDNVSYERLGKMRSHLAGFYSSVRLSLAMVRGDEAWLPLYFLAIYDYLPPERFKTLFYTPRFRTVSGRISPSLWDEHSRQISQGGEFSLTLENEESPTIVFTPWKEAGSAYFETGWDVRTGWNLAWPHFRVDYDGGNVIKRDLWTIMKNASITYDVPYTSISEAVSDIIGIKEQNLKFPSSNVSHGSIIFPIFARFESAGYDRTQRQLQLLARIVYHSKVKPTNLYVSAKAETRDQNVRRLRKTQLTNLQVIPSEGDLSRVEWHAPVDLDATTLSRTSFFLVYNGMTIDDTPLLIDQEYLHYVRALVSESEIQRLMADMDGRRRLDSHGKIEKLLLEGKGASLEEGTFMLLSRIGFNVSWQSRESPFDILAASPNGCLLVECTSDPPSIVMAEELRDIAKSYRSRENARVLPIIVTNQTSLTDLDRDLMQMQQSGEVCFLTRDRLIQLLSAVDDESLRRTDRYVEQYFRW